MVKRLGSRSKWLSQGLSLARNCSTAELPGLGHDPGIAGIRLAPDVSDP